MRRPDSVSSLTYQANAIRKWCKTLGWKASCVSTHLVHNGLLNTYHAAFQEFTDFSRSMETRRTPRGSYLLEDRVKQRRLETRAKKLYPKAYRKGPPRWVLTDEHGVEQRPPSTNPSTPRRDLTTTQAYTFLAGLRYQRYEVAWDLIEDAARVQRIRHFARRWSLKASCHWHQPGFGPEVRLWNFTDLETGAPLHPRAITDALGASPGFAAGLTDDDCRVILRNTHGDRGGFELPPYMAPDRPTLWCVSVSPTP